MSEHEYGDNIGGGDIPIRKEQDQDAWELALADARLDGERTGYVKALGDVIAQAKKHHEGFGYYLRWTLVIINELKSDYLKESENGKTE